MLESGERGVRMVDSVRIVTDLSRDEVEGGVLITGFRGFGLVGYLVSKHIALALRASKRGIILTPLTPPVILMEEDGVGYPFEIYFHRDRRIVVIVNRANPEREVQGEYTSTLASWASDMGISLAILVGGLNNEFMEPGDKHGYRWVGNEYYIGRRPPAPTMERGLGVIGPLALLYLHLTLNKIPTIMVLPYAMADRTDYEAVVRGIKVISSEILGLNINIREVERMAALQRERAAESEFVERMLQQSERENDEEESGIYM